MSKELYKPSLKNTSRIIHPPLLMGHNDQLTWAVKNHLETLTLHNETFTIAGSSNFLAITIQRIIALYNFFQQQV